MDDRKNILFLHHVSCLAGAERYLLSLVENLDEKYKSFLICQEPGPLSDHLCRIGVTAHFLKLGAWRKFKNWLDNIATIKTIIKYCSEKNIHLICSNSYRVTPYAVLAAKKLGIPTVSIIHDFVDNEKLKKFHVFNSDFVIAVSRSVSGQIRQYYRARAHPKGNLAHIYNGIDIDSFKRLVKPTDIFSKHPFKEEFHISDKTKVVGVVANIIPLKGHYVFFDAIEIVVEKFPNIVCVIVGDSPDKQQLSLDDLRAYVDSLGLSEKMIFTGSRKDIANIISSFDVLVHPSFKEAFGRVIIEAMALGVPVVATRSGGPSEIISNLESGLLSPTGEPERLAENIISLLMNEKRAKTLGLSGQKRIKELFSLEKTAKKFNKIFDKLLAAYSTSHKKWK